MFENRKVGIISVRKLNIMFAIHTHSQTHTYTQSQVQRRDYRMYACTCMSSNKTLLKCHTYFGVIFLIYTLCLFLLYPFFLLLLLLLFLSPQTVYHGIAWQHILSFLFSVFIVHLPQPPAVLDNQNVISLQNKANKNKNEKKNASKSCHVLGAFQSAVSFQNSQHFAPNRS